MKYSIKKYKGIGLIEVLLTTLVVALGLLAVASLQGNLMGISGSNKARAEAKMLCETKLEQLRDVAVRGVTTSTTAGEFNAIASSTAEESIAGNNETIRRSWVVTNLPNSTNPTHKQISVTCRWDDPNAPDIDKQIVVQTIIAYDSLKSAIKVASTGAGSMTGDPSTNAGSSTVITDKTDVAVTGTAGSLVTNQSWDGKEDGQYLKVNANGTSGSVVYKCKNDTSLAAADRFIPFNANKHENILYTRRVHSYPDETSFREAIELAERNTKVVNGVTVGDGLFDSGTVDSCTRKIRYNGGIMLPLSGTVYSNASGHSLIDIDLLTFDASESGIYCHFDPASSSTKAPYVCYAGGNCTYGPVGTTYPKNADGTDNTDAGTVVIQCPYSSSTDVKPYSIMTSTSATIEVGDVYSTVGPGGWRGEVGLLGVARTNSDHDTVCFAEEIAGSPATLNTARNYYTRRGSGFRSAGDTTDLAKNEGINKPYMCHDFLIVTGQQNVANIHRECANQVGLLDLASKTISRTTTVANSVEPLDSNSKNNCVLIIGHTITNVTSVTATTADGFFDCTLTGSNTYECAGTAIAATSVAVSGRNAAGTTIATRAVPVTVIGSDCNPNCDLASTTPTSTTTTTAGTTTTTSSSSTSSTSTTTSTTTTTTAGSCTKTITGSVTKNTGGSSANTRVVTAGAISCNVSGNANSATYTCSNVTATCGTAVTMTCTTNCSPASTTFTLSAPTGGTVTGPSFTSP